MTGKIMKAAPDLQLSAVEEQQTARFFCPLFFCLQGASSLLSHDATSSRWGSSRSLSASYTFPRTPPLQSDRANLRYSHQHHEHRRQHTGCNQCLRVALLCSELLLCMHFLHVNENSSTQCHDNIYTHGSYNADLDRSQFSSVLSSTFTLDPLSK